MKNSTAPSPASAPRSPAQTVFAWVAAIHAVLICVQPILAGVGLEGNDAATDAHFFNGMATMGVAVVLIITAIVWKLTGGQAQAIGLAVFMLVLELAMFALGETEKYSIHLPLGIVLLAGSVMVARMGFRGPRASRKAVTKEESAVSTTSEV